MLTPLKTRSARSLNIEDRSWAVNNGLASLSRHSFASSSSSAPATDSAAGTRTLSRCTTDLASPIQLAGSSP